MSSLQQRILAAMTARIDQDQIVVDGNVIHKPTGLVVGRSWNTVADLVNNPGEIGCVLSPGENVPVTSGGPRVFAVEHTFTVLIELEGAAAEGETPDQTLDPIMSWIVMALLPDRNLGNLAKSIVEGKASWMRQEGNHSYGKVHWLWTVAYYTKGNNREAMP